MLSKELLGEVLGVEVTEGIYFKEEDDEVKEIDMAITTRKNMLTYWRRYTEWGENTKVHASCIINIHELAFKCKKWAYEKHKEEVSSAPSKEEWFATSKSLYTMSMDGVYANSEPEAIFKACQWILENKGA